MKERYLEDSYLWSFAARVVEASEARAVLDETAFYPQSGGQPADAGTLTRGSDVFRVAGVEKDQRGVVVHILDRPGLEPGDSIQGEIDGQRRYQFMRSHTACHILSAVIFRETGAKITGNQIEQS